MINDQEKEIGLYTKTLSGHRASYLDFIRTKIGGERIQGQSIFFWKGAVFFLMVEDNFSLYFFACIFRSVLGKRTVGLLFRPKPVIESTKIKHKIKFWMLKFLCQFSETRTISIVPIALEPAISEIVDDWVYDFQLWDLTVSQKDTVKKIKEKYMRGDPKLLNDYEVLRDIGAYNLERKKIIVSLGAQNKSKGIHQLSSYCSDLIKNDYCLVIAGRFSANESDTRRNIIDSGGVVIDRYLSDEEILVMYAIADAVWCFYDPSYDQASGILGRAIQLGVLPVVRKKSYSELLCVEQNIDHISLDDPRNLAMQLGLLINTTDNKDIRCQFEIESMTKIKNALCVYKSEING